MPQRFNPFQQFFSDTPLPRDGARLFFYLEASSTKHPTYPTLADAQAGTGANDNPVELDEFGQAEVDIWLLDVSYKVVLAGPDSTGTDDPPTNVIKTLDVYRHSAFDIFSIRKTGSGNPNGSVAGTAGSAGVLPTEYWDYTNRILYECTTTGTASTAVWTALNASSATPAVPPPQGRLTLTSGTPVLSSDVVAGTAVYYTPYVGNLIPMYNGASMVPAEFSELTLTLASQHALSTIYDVFAFSNSGVVTIATGPAWSVSTAGSGARGTGASTTELTRVKGLWVNAVQMTGRNGSTTYTIGANLGTYVGSLYIDGTAGQVTCHTSFGQSRKWGVWNAFNRCPIIMKGGDSTASWTYALATFRQSNNAAGNKITPFCGLDEEFIHAEFRQAVSGNGFQIAIGVDSTTTQSGYCGSQNSAALQLPVLARHIVAPILGISNINMLERSPSTNSNTHFGGETNMQMAVSYLG